MSRPITVASVIANAKGNKRQTFGQSLYLVVRGGSARWEYQFRDPTTKRLKSMWLGSAIGADAVSLTDAKLARAKAWTDRRTATPTPTPTVAPVIAPTPPVALPPGNGMTFGDALEAYIVEHGPHWRGGADGREAKQWRAALAKSTLAPLTLGQITEATKRDCLMVFPAIQRERIRKRIGAVVEFMVTGRSAPKRPNVNHMPAMKWQDVPRFFDMLGDVEGDKRKLVAKALRWTILTACRAGDVLGMTWGELNGDWIIPGPRHKSGKEFRVPITAAMRACLPKERGADGDKVFRMGFMEMIRLMRRHDETLTVHGFRTSFSTWAADNGADFEVREACLAHKVGNEASRAYQRSDLFERRRELMQQWCDYVTKLA